ncbi:hypothetical protein V8E36_005657 [Tilletia maclaganii]
MSGWIGSALGLRSSTRTVQCGLLWNGIIALLQSTGVATFELVGLLLSVDVARGEVAAIFELVGLLLSVDVARGEVAAIFELAGLLLSVDVARGEVAPIFELVGLLLSIDIARGEVAPIFELVGLLLSIDIARGEVAAIFELAGLLLSVDVAGRHGTLADVEAGVRGGGTTGEIQNARADDGGCCGTKSQSQGGDEENRGAQVRHVWCCV